MSLRQHTIKSFIWQSVGTFGSGIIGLLITMFLARHLTPSDFGIVEIILSFVVISEVLIDSGFSQAIIREKDLNNNILTGVFVVNFIVSLIIYIILFLSASFISTYFNLPHEFIWYFRILNLKLIVDSFGFSQIANCIRQMKFEIIAQTSLFGIVLAALASVLCISYDYGIWALVVYYLAQSFFKTVFIIFKVRWRPSTSMDFTKIYDFIKFGGNIMIVQLVDKTITSVESMCIGKSYSSAELGNFSQSRKLDSMIIQTLLGVVQKVSYPALSKIERQDQLKYAYAEIMQLAFWVVLPIAVFCFFFPEMVIETMFGKKWVSAAPFLRIFSIFSMFIPIQSIGMNIFMVKKRTGLMRNINIIKQSLRLILIFILIRYSILTFTIGIVVVSVFGSCLYVYYGGKLIDYTVDEILKDNLKTFLTALIIGGILKYLWAYSQFEGVLENLMIFGLGFSSLYLFVSILLKNRAWCTLSNLISYSYNNRRRF